MGRFLWMSCCQTSLFILVGGPCFSQMSLIITVSGRVVKNLPANIGDARNACSIPVSRRSPGVGNGNPFQYSCLENAMDRGAWQAIVVGVTKSQTRLSTHAHSFLDISFFLSFLPSFEFGLNPSMCDVYLHMANSKCGILKYRIMFLLLFSYWYWWLITLESLWVTCGSFLAILSDISTHFTRVINYMILC